MRIAFVNELYKQAKREKNIILISGDLGFSVFEKYIEDIPNQFLNAGVAEQNMTGVAAGMALEGKIPFIYSIVPFVTMRNFEQVKNDICYQNVNVKIVGVGAGFSYAIYGHTHYSLEDIAILRVLPNMTILCPGDPIEAQWAVKAALQIKGPVYIRLGKTGEPIVHKEKTNFKIGKGVILKEGKDITIFATSTMLFRALEVADELKKKGIKSRVISMHTIKPLDKALIIDSAKKTKALFSLEEHFIMGGLGSAVAEVLAESEYKTIFKRIGVVDVFSKKTGSQEFMRQQNGLSKEKIIAAILEKINQK